MSDRVGPAESAAPLLEVVHARVWFPARRGLRGLRGRAAPPVRALDDVSLTVGAGETLGVVGESGCGKTTLARAIVRLVEPTGGTIRFAGQDVTAAGRRELRALRRQMQLVFQDALGALNPRQRVGRIVGAPLRLHARGRVDVDARVGALLESVGLDRGLVTRFPHELSGGQRQRVGIARALALEPRLIVLDEPVAALDVSLQAQVINLLADLQAELGLAYVFIAHDLAVVRHVADRIAVMYLGKVVETSPAEELCRRPIHPYTAGLLHAVPVPDPARARRPVVEGEPPDPAAPPSGCRFRTRCPRATAICARSEPPLTAYAGGRLAACHHPLNVTAAELAAARRSPLSPLTAGDERPRPRDGTGAPDLAVGS